MLPRNDFIRAATGLVYAPAYGLGAPLVLVHGIYPGARRDEFHRNVRPLSSHFRVIAPDLPGFGESDAPRMTYTSQVYHHALRDLIATTCDEPAVVVASGVSCAFAVRLAVYDDALVRRLVLICPVDDQGLHHEPSLAERASQFLHGTLRLGAGLYESVTEKPALREFLESRFAEPARHVTPQRVEALLYDALRPGAMYPYLSLVNGYYDLDVLRMLRYVRVPTLIVWGHELGELPRDQIDAPSVWSQGKSVEVIDHAKHWPHDEQSGKVNALIREFYALPLPAGRGPGACPERSEG